MQLATNSMHRLFESNATATVNAEAYTNYVKGKYFLGKDAPQTAIEYFRQAIAQDPNFAQGYVGLAHGYTMLPVLTATSSREVTPKIRAAATKLCN